MKKIVTLAILGMLSFASVAADNVVITTGKQGMVYNGVYGANMKSALLEFGHTVEVVTSKGSLENLDRVAKGEAQIALVQADALMYWMAPNANLAGNVEVAGELGEECIFAAVKEDGPIKTEDDIKAGTKVAVGVPTSGSFASWSYMQQLNSSYAKATTYAKGGLRTLSKVITGEYDVFMWTAAINKSNDYLNIVQAKGSGLKLIDLDDWDMNDKLPNGNSVYEFRNAVVKSGFITNDSVKVPCMKTLVVVNADADEQLLDDVATIMLKNRSRILGK